VVTEFGYICSCHECPYYNEEIFIVDKKHWCDNMDKEINFDTNQQFDNFCPLKEDDD
jgi:hypothetical protein